MAYIGNGPGTIRQGRRAVYEFTSTANQTAFSGTDENGLTLDLLQANDNDVYLNGVRLIITDDYTISGDVLTLTSGAASGDKLIIMTQDEIANDASYSKAASDSRYINYDGDIVNGTIQIGGSGNNITFADNNKAIFGDGDDLQIYHSGTHSWITNSTGYLHINAANIELKNAADNETMLLATQNGAVKLSYDNSVKLATTSTGIDVTGGVTAQNALFSAYIDFQTGGVNKGNIYTDANTMIINTQGTNTTLNTNGGNVGIGTSSPSERLSVVAEDDTSPIDNGFSIYRSVGDDKVTINSQGGAAKFVADGGSSYIPYRFYGYNGTTLREDLTIFSDGNVGIGTSNPAHKLEVAGTTKAEQYLLDAVAKDISDTAVDVFIYDTRKDSDGGAWRKRTQNTSWYNETLNTATRGARKEFPAVAVIVAESGTVTIYDGDDPDMPMWMVFNGNAGIIYYTHAISSVTMLNGILAITRPISYGVGLTNFVSDSSQNIRNHFGIYTYNGSISERNASKQQTLLSSNPLVDGNANDVSMTVLPNAPIDSATGLPVPTIAVATNGGVSVIKDNGTVVDLTDSAGGQSTKVMFTQDGKLAYAHDGATSIRIDSIPLLDFSYGSNKVARGNSEEFYINSSLTASGWSGETPKILSGSFAHKGLIVKADNKFGLAQTGSKGLTQLDRSLGEVGKAKNMVQYTTSTYNTGWMNGDIKLATLSDTDATDFTPPPELITNGTFNTDVSGWSNNATEILTWNSSGYAQVNRNGGSSQGQCYQNITTEVGKAYIVKVDVIAVSHGFQVYAALASIPSSSGSNVTNTTGTFYWWFTASSTTTRIDLSAVQSGSGTASFDNVSVKLAESDRSVNGKGLQVFGTVTKSAVATGADLMAYSGFSSTNYLEQPYNSDLDFGTGDFSFMVWLNMSNNAQTGIIFHRSAKNISDGAWGGSGAIIQAEFNGTSLYGHVATDAFNTVYGPSVPYAEFANNTWTHYALVRRSGVLYAYVNGEEYSSAANTLTTTNTSAKLYVGERPVATRPLYGKMALHRFSATAPSPEQIKKIYNDEKHLFQENAKATLYGSSDAVTALAYDDDTELLHVGTSAGRSVFQGLRRIDNTTDAVGAAISASNGMVAED